MSHKYEIFVGTTGTETAFLPESELPDCARLSTLSEEDVMTRSRKELEEKDLQRAIQNSKQGNILENAYYSSQIVNLVGKFWISHVLYHFICILGC